MAGEILVVFAFLETLEHHARVTAEALDAASRLMNVEFTGNPDVTAAYAAFLGRWDEHRRGLCEGIVAAADAFRAVREAFAQADDQLVAALTGGSP